MMEESTMNKLWYAVMTDNDDNDWGIGSYSIDEAKQMVLDNLDIYPDGYIAVIDNSNPDNPVCVNEIRDF